VQAGSTEKYYLQAKDTVGEETGFLVELQDKFGNLWSGWSTTKFLYIVTLEQQNCT
jgi:hypothetical protein